jgi:glycogen debranching enzyme
LVTNQDDRVRSVFDQLFDPSAFGAPYGPAGVHQGEPSFRRDEYWRGVAWPQLTYLFFVAAQRRGRHDVARRLAASAAMTALDSGFAEYVDPLDGTGLGAIPQGWAGLPCVIERLLPSGSAELR